MTSTMDYKVFYKSPWGVAFIAYFVAMGLVGALTPPDILTAYGWTRPFTDFMASIVPQIDKVTALGIDPDINRFYFSVMWAGSPVLCVFMFASGGAHRKNSRNFFIGESLPKRHLLNMPFFSSLGVISLVVFFMVVSYYIEWSTGSKTRLVTSTFGTNIGRFAMPQVFVMGPLMFGYILFMWVLGWLTGYIPRNIRKQNELENIHGK